MFSKLGSGGTGSAKDNLSHHNDIGDEHLVAKIGSLGEKYIKVVDRPPACIEYLNSLALPR